MTQPTIDALRTKYGRLGFALYALEPGGEVTLECVNEEGKIFTFRGATEEAAILAGFADDFAAPAAAPTPTPSVFD